MSDDGCVNCGGDLTVGEDDNGEYDVCVECGRRQDGLGELQDRFGGIFGGGR